MNCTGQLIGGMLESMTGYAPIRIEMPSPAAARNGDLLPRLVELINRVYAVAEEGLWQAGTARVTAPEIADLVATGQIAVAHRGEDLVGSIRVHDVDADTSEFGMLVSAPEQRGTGIGRELVAYAERYARDRGRRAMQLELLVPRHGRHPSKDFLASWYARIGYQVLATRQFADAYPQLAPLLAIPCELLVYEKPLSSERGLVNSTATAGGRTT